MSAMEYLRREPLGCRLEVSRHWRAKLGMIVEPSVWMLAVLLQLLYWDDRSAWPPALPKAAKA
jgi:hypothetical protein